MDTFTEYLKAPDAPIGVKGTNILFFNKCFTQSPAGNVNVVCFLQNFIIFIWASNNDLSIVEIVSCTKVLKAVCLMDMGKEINWKRSAAVSYAWEAILQHVYKQSFTHMKTNYPTGILQQLGSDCNIQWTERNHLVNYLEWTEWTYNHNKR